MSPSLSSEYAECGVQIQAAGAISIARVAL